ncbi:glycosyltransferase family 39 protein [Geitlerinema sp. PCC 9228]|jgi:hypothetical protein|uniref:ArnT family glycosyltransferase n=1 Tax=Geitlerinema sp. PCC 9228 TaxID=111611 RepID=UPI0008F9A432|nr:glycosyltransferase family 39 protein [Geitlerinema sp. PCC 9228]
MLVVLPIVTLVLLFVWLRRKGHESRHAMMAAALIWGILLTAFTEILSLFQGFEPSGLTFCWGNGFQDCTWISFLWSLFFVTIGWILAWLLPGFSLSGLALFWGASVGIMSLLVWQQKSFKETQEQSQEHAIHIWRNVWVWCIVFIVATVGAIAFISPPNNWDSMTYHLGRVLHWIQNQSVDHYQTNIPRQLYSGPWGSYAIAHLQILTDSDRLFNIPQWLAMVGSIIGVSLIAKQLGADIRGQILAALICATLPIGILQGSSTQTDYIIAFWVVCFAYFTLKTLQEQCTLTYVPYLGASLGLAILTKGTAYLYVFPFCIWLGISGLWQLRWRLWQPIIGVGAIALALNAAYYIRNYIWFGSILGPSTNQQAGGFNLVFFISGIIRNLALHISTPVPSINQILINAIEQFHQVVLGISAEEPSITSPPGQNFGLHSLINHEDLAGNGLHLLLTFLALGYFLGKYRQMQPRQRYFLGVYFLAVAAGFLLFCALIIWSPWRSRLHLSVFVLAAAFVGTVFGNLIQRRLLANSLAGLLFVSSLLWVFFNESRPLIANSQIVETDQVVNIFNQSRRDLYFINRPDLQQPYTAATDWLRSQSCSQIGLSIGGDTWEYPLWMLLGEEIGGNPVRIKHVNVSNKTSVGAVFQKETFTPCAIFAYDSDAAQQSELTENQRKYTQAWSQEGMRIFWDSNVSLK